jgi:orotidine-5'-phosphate decarboxylase
VSERLIVALDTNDLTRASEWAAAVAPHCGLVKLGLEFFLANGPAGVLAIKGRPVFLDLKLHDIPNTVAGAVRAVLPLMPRMLTLHAAGGAEMIEAARNAAEHGGAARPMLLAVTVLTSLSAGALAATGMDGDPARQVLRLGRLAIAAGADGLVCSPLEVAMLRDALGPGVKLVVPGIRLAGAAADDQARTMTPEQAVAAGVDWIVVGRPITGAPDVGAAAAGIAAAIG